MPTSKACLCFWWERGVLTEAKCPREMNLGNLCLFLKDPFFFTDYHDFLKDYQALWSIARNPYGAWTILFIFLYKDEETTLIWRNNIKKMLKHFKVEIFYFKRSQLISYLLVSVLFSESCTCFCRCFSLNFSLHLCSLLLWQPSWYRVAPVTRWGCCECPFVLALSCTAPLRLHCLQDTCSFISVDSLGVLIKHST